MGNKSKFNGLNGSDSNTYIFKLGHTIDTILVNDLVPDCGKRADDEKTLTDVLENRKRHNCSQPDEILCRKGHTKCFSITEICLYRLNSQNQCEDFECNMKFKCSKSYCIPWVYVCNGKWDCPHGYDESKEHFCGERRQCNMMFHCSKSQLCIHIEDICNGYNDCPLKDDEYMCSLKGLICPKSCLCHQFALGCFQGVLRKTVIFGTLPYTSVFISNIIIPDNNILKSFVNATIAQLPGNNIQSICNGLFLNSRQIIVLNMAVNKINLLDKYCFEGLVQLQHIFVNNNLLKVIHSEAFYNLVNLKYINLSNNFLEHFQKTHGH